MLKEYKFEEQCLKEMANLRTEKTGLDHGTIYMSSKEGNHGARIKFYRGRAGNNPSASITISNSPEVIEDAIGLKASEIKELFSFVVKNRKILIKAWNEGSTMYTDEWEALLKSIKKI